MDLNQLTRGKPGALHYISGITHDTQYIIVAMSLKRYRYRAYPRKGQKQLVAALFGCVRVVFNDALAYSVEQYKETGRKPSSGELSARLTRLKRTPGKTWLRDVPAVPLQQSLRDLDRAYTNFFASVTGKRRGPGLVPHGSGDAQTGKPLGSHPKRSKSGKPATGWVS